MVDICQPYIKLWVVSKDSMDQELTQKEKEVLNLLLNEFLTPREIALRRQTSRQTIYKTLKKLKKMGLISGTSLQGYRGLSKNGIGRQPLSTPTTKLRNNFIRLHREEWNVKIIAKSLKYSINIGKITKIDGNTVRFYKNSLEIYISKEFIGEDTTRVDFLSLNYITKILVKLENLYNILLLKERSENIKRVYGHYADLNNGIAKERREKKKRLAIYSKIDGKLRLHTDYSNMVDEMETEHPETAKEDMDTVKNYITDILENDHLIPSENKKLLIAVASNQDMFNKNIKLHMKVLKNMDKTMTNIRRELKNGNNRRD